jgi:hypothetical protein
MTQTTPIIGANKSGLTYRQEDNDGKQALLNHHKGSGAPAYAEAGMIWLDDGATPWLLKAYDGADWIVLGAVNASANTFLPYTGTAGLRLLNHASDTGSANAYAVAPSPPISAYATGQIVTLKPANANTGASTLNVNSLGTKNIKMPDGTALPSGVMSASGVYSLMYDGSNFVLMNPATVINWLLARGTALASASTVDIGTADSDYVEISGTTTITSLGSTTTRNHVWVRFQGMLTLTHNATSLVLPTGANITTAAGDVAEFVRISGGNWQCLGYVPISGKPVAAIARADLPAGSTIQTVSATYTSNTDLTATIPLDDTIPQITEGTEVVTVTITPTSATSTIEISFNAFGAASSASVLSAALFKDSGPNALQVSTMVAGGGSLPDCISLAYAEGAVNTTSRTYRIRVGLSSGTCRLNGTLTSRLFGGAAAACVIAREIKG